MIRKPSFLERLTGSKLSTYDDEEEFFDDDEYNTHPRIHDEEDTDPEEESWQEEQAIEEEVDGELPIDMYHTPDAIVIRALVAGVNPNDLDIAITRDMVTIKGSREEVQEAPDENYFHRELFWGSFTRTVLLPDEVLIDEADAREKHGLLEIILPKVDKDRSARLNVKTLGK